MLAPRDRNECFDDRFVAQLVAGTLPGTDRQVATAHIDDCAACRDLIAEAAIATAEQPAPGYQVAGEVARGAMGRIVVARDLRLDREVALKQLIEPTPALRRRFEREVTITAALQHPGIVPVYHAGTLSDGEPFYAMRRVRGRGLDIVIAEATTIAQRFALLPRVLAAVEAVAYAHSERVIHRDLKPQNILVGDFGETVVVDWGLAKRLGEADDVAEERHTHDTALTRDGTVLGTPAYMAPEQAAAGETDERADVYALGAVLYHALSGRAPHAGGSLTTTLENVREGRVTPLAGHVAGVPADLIAIVDRAMAVDPAARYPNAGALADDLRGFLAGKLVGAHDYTRWQLVKRWIGRHRAWVLAAAAVVVGLGVMGAISFSRVQAERDTAERQRDTARVERSSAESLVHSGIQDVYGALDESGQHEAITKLSKRVVEYYDQVLAVRPDDKISRAYRAMALDQQANVAFRTGDVATAEKIWTEVLPVLRDARTVDDSAALDVGLDQFNLGNIARMRGDTDKAEQLYKAAIADLEPMFVKAPGEIGSALAGSLDGIAQLRMVALDPAGARPFSERALAVAQQGAAVAQPEDTDVHARVAQLAYTLGSLDALEGKHDAARKMFELGITTLGKLPPEAAYATSIGYQRFSLALLEITQGNLDACKTQIDKGRAAIAPAIAGGYDDPQVLRVAAMFDLVDAYRLLAANHARDALGAADKAAAQLAELATKHAFVAQFKRDHAQSVATRARVLAVLGRAEQARTEIKQTLAVMEANAGASPRGKLELATASIVAAQLGVEPDAMLARATKLLDEVKVSAKPPLAHARAYAAAVRAHLDPAARDGYREARAALDKGRPLSLPTLPELDRLAGI
jgi:tetratricopeptide (TPR) repeat protein